ncbi:hypothetical protein [Donghicola eburneus]|uniref:hypothetical protein n=1 Tax=Donghicola eburneus TaxID=393278 RepID=UPI0008F36FC0|nr:hypothetical protein [Donghicola eburneus]SFQ77743.1 RNA polymerase sigma factor, sigma-70 family [Donghicola eburneus]
MTPQDAQILAYLADPRPTDWLAFANLVGKSLESLRSTLIQRAYRFGLNEAEAEDMASAVILRAFQVLSVQFQGINPERLTEEDTSILKEIFPNFMGRFSAYRAFSAEHDNDAGDRNLLKGWVLSMVGWPNGQLGFGRTFQKRSMRKRQREQSLSMESGEYATYPDPDAGTAEEALIFKEGLDVLDRAIQTLPPRDQVIYRLARGQHPFQRLTSSRVVELARKSGMDRHELRQLAHSASRVNFCGARSLSQKALGEMLLLSDRSIRNVIARADERLNVHLVANGYAARTRKTG